MSDACHTKVRKVSESFDVVVSKTQELDICSRLRADSSQLASAHAK